eukprot:Awhi_evm2s9935
MSFFNLFKTRKNRVSPVPSSNSHNFNRSNSITSSSSTQSNHSSSSSSHKKKRNSIPSLILNLCRFDADSQQINDLATDVYNKVELLTSSPNFDPMSCKGDIPTPRSGHIALCDEDNAYLHVFGGYHDGRCYNDVYSFHLASKTWIKRHCTGKTPSERVSHQGVIRGNSMLVFGGSNVPFGHSNTNDFWVLNLTTFHWKKMTFPGESPCPRYGHSLVMHKNKLYLFGGTSGCVYFNDLYELDFTKGWTMLKDNSRVNPDVDSSPSPRYRHEAVCDEERMYILGGGIPNPTKGSIPVFSYHFANKTWEKHTCSSPAAVDLSVNNVNGFPLDRRSHTCVMHNDSIYMYGGTDGAVMFSDFWLLNVKTMTWKFVTMKNTKGNAKCFHSASMTTEGQMLLFGGCADSNGNVRSNEISNVYTEVPSLQHLAKQLLAADNNIKNKLSTTGLPQHIIRQIAIK